MTNNEKETNWNEYYTERNNSNLSSGFLMYVLGKIMRVTSSITEKHILKMLDKHMGKNINLIIEAGGGDSCFYSVFRKHYKNSTYLALDSSEVGVATFNSKYASDKTTALCQNILDMPHDNYNADMVFSAGLIEHFDTINTAKMIESHFNLCKVNGYVLMTFPTPTFLYRIVRKTLEILKIWQFHDERPLKLTGVKDVSKEYGTMLESKLNWLNPATQYIVLFKKNKI